MHRVSCLSPALLLLYASDTAPQCPDGAAGLWSSAGHCSVGVWGWGLPPRSLSSHPQVTFIIAATYNFAVLKLMGRDTKF